MDKRVLEGLARALYSHGRKRCPPMTPDRALAHAVLADMLEEEGRMALSHIVRHREGWMDCWRRRWWFTSKDGRDFISHCLE